MCIKRSFSPRGNGQFRTPRRKSHTERTDFLAKHFKKYAEMLLVRQAKPISNEVQKGFHILGRKLTRHSLSG